MERAKRVLVVDDEAGIRCLLSEVLSNEGFEVSLAKDGMESLNELEKNDFDLVVTDIQMPRIDGIEMLKRMDQAGRKEKVIIISGSPLNWLIPVIDLPQVVSHLEKPFPISHFVEKVTAAVADEAAVETTAIGAENMLEPIYRQSAVGG